jgi:prepilin signal peptidase PulO-like enzyme (type II secretory pathway)
MSQMQMWLASAWISGSLISGSLAPGMWEDAVFVGAAFVVGAMVGSFINVVVYRVPHGRTVVHGRSACPTCGHVVRPRDNVPILGWLLLGGRCRDCKTPISPAYAVVEAACGLALAMLAVGEIVAWRSTGSSLPLIERGLVLEEWSWLSGWAGRAVAILTCVTWALLARGGHVVTWRTTLVATAIVAALVAAAAPAPGWGFMHALGGALAGWLAGWLARFGAGGAVAHRILVLACAAAGVWPAGAGGFWPPCGG